jgi:hypothetical protein
VTVGPAAPGGGPVAPAAPAGPPPASTVAGATPAGLPRRMPGGLLLSGHAVSPQELAGLDDGTQPPDPDAIRARLSGLASGLAQAARQTQARP